MQYVHLRENQTISNGARFTLKDGKQRSMEEIIDTLIEDYEKSNKERKKDKEE
jgi:hypothetical protein